MADVRMADVGFGVAFGFQFWGVGICVLGLGFLFWCVLSWLNALLFLRDDNNNKRIGKQQDLFIFAIL